MIPPGPHCLPAGMVGGCPAFSSVNWVHQSTYLIVLVTLKRVIGEGLQIHSLPCGTRPILAASRLSLCPEGSHLWEDYSFQPEKAFSQNSDSLSPKMQVFHTHTSCILLRLRANLPLNISRFLSCGLSSPHFYASLFPAL